MKNALYILLFCLFSIYCFAQQFPGGQKIKTIPGNYVSFSIDNLDNIYLVSTSNQLKKLSAVGDEVSVFNEIKKFGEVTWVDVSNPVRLLLYYKGFSSIVLLDGMLNQRAAIDLRRKNLFNVSAISLSYDNKIWLYDEMDNKLKKIDEEGNVIFVTADFRQLFDKALSPIRIFDQSQYVYLYDSLQGIYVFDYYGTYKSKIDIVRWQHVSVSDKIIYGTYDGKLCQYNTATLKLSEWPIPEAFRGYKQIFKKNNKLYALGNDGLEIYLLNETASF
ncbi:hypothetical protein PIECOFPK_00388 [Mycovorax composti]|uniref:Uncharacterized protein n=1 Tax=Mycovorax composti TaxID=2962693 RepID=A0ABZ2EGZ3_9BACT